MAYILVIPERVQKEIDKIDSRYQPSIKIALIGLRGDPFLGKKLSGKHKDERSYEVWPYRIVYKIKKYELIILIITVSHRQGVYK